MASSTILLCGYGLGFLLGEKKGKAHAISLTVSSPASGDEKASWVRRTLKKFDSELQLSPAQKRTTQRELSQTYDAIRESRLSALKQYSSHIITLHDKLLPHLNDSQKTLILEQQHQLQETLELGFQ